MKKFYLLSKTLLVAALLCVGQNAWGATETYDFSNYVVTENLGYSTGRDITLTGDDIATADASTVKLVSGVSSGTSFDFGGRFAVQSTTVKFRNGNSQGKATTYKVNKGIQYATGSGSNHFSILNLKKNDIVTITTGSGTTKFASTNAKVGGSQVTQNQRVGSDATTGDVGSTTVCTMTADGNLDLIMEGWAVIMSVTINNDTHSVEEGDIVSDGTTVNDVYGITMTYHGTWTISTSSYAGSGKVASSTAPTTWATPLTGNYLEFTPSVTGELFVKAAYFAKQRIIMYKSDGSEQGQVRFSSNSSSSTPPQSFGVLIAGHTYYLLKNENNYNFDFKSFVYTPKPEYYRVEPMDNIEVGTQVTCVPGVTMTYGGAAESTWSKNVTYSHSYAENSGNNASLTDGIPTSGTFVKFTPSVNGILRIGSIGYPGAKTCYVKLTDGVKTETITHDKSTESNGYKDDTFETILASGTTYYVYFSGGSSGYYSKFCDFSFEKIPSTVTATITPAGWASFSSSYPLDLSTITGGEAYYASTSGETSVTLTPTTAKVPANTGLMIKGTAGAEFTIATTSDETTDLSASNLLKATDGNNIAASTDAKKHYVFGFKKPEDVVTEYGFYNLASATSVEAGKAYLEITTGGSGARALRISLGGITEVENVEAVPEAKAQEGKFIENGKLVIIKNGVKYNAAGAKLY